MENNICVGGTRSIPLKKPHNIKEDKVKLYKSAKEMESLFLYYVLKAMRQTIPEGDKTEQLGMGLGMGKDIYTQMFDEELAKNISGKGSNSLANLLYKSLERTVEKESGMVTGEGKAVSAMLPRAKFIKISPEKIDPIELNQRPAGVNPDHQGDSGKVASKGIISIRNMNQNLDESKVNETTDKSSTAIGSAKQAANDFSHIIKRAAEKYSLNPSLLSSIIKAESNGNPRAVSPAGAKGLMQLADTTAADMGVKDVFNPEENIEAGAKFLRRLIDKFGDIKKALAAYNAGPEKVKQYGGIPPYPETVRYIQTVLGDIPDQTYKYE
ncbi:MAG: transglycosylase SLT domain-containing protein [candidate division Zixibacteria bacterium]|nr:transglycosylase SLT domain-containing protein [candidate division Zixibacteria bacterium]